MLKREKIIKYRKVLFENSASAWNSYKFIRNIYKVKISSESMFISNEITNTSNQREMWNKIKELVLKTPKNLIKSVVFNNIEYNINSK